MSIWASQTLSLSVLTQSLLTVTWGGGQYHNTHFADLRNWGTQHLSSFPGLQCRGMSLISLGAEAPGLTLHYSASELSLSSPPTKGLCRSDSRAKPRAWLFYLLLLLRSLSWYQTSCLGINLNHCKWAFRGAQNAGCQIIKMWIQPVYSASKGLTHTSLRFTFTAYVSD